MPKVIENVEKSLLEEKTKLEQRLVDLQYMFEGSQARITREQQQQQKFATEFQTISKRLGEIAEALAPKEEAKKDN